MTRRIAIAARVGAASLLLAGTVVAAGTQVALGGDPCFHRMDNRPAVTTAAATTVAIDDCSFGPTVTWVPEGSLVTWRNVSTQGHEIVGSNVTWGAHDKILEPGDSMGWTFDSSGVYPYSCMLHPGMTGAVVVGEAGAPAAAGEATDAQPVQAVTNPAPGGDGVGWAIGAVAGGALSLGFGAAIVARRRRPTAVSAS